MSGLPEHSVKLGPDFDESVDSVENRYYKKLKKFRQQFRDRVSDVVASIAADPNTSGTRPEPWPKKTAIPNWDFRKITFKMPGLSGAPGQGRLVYLVDQVNHVIWPCFIYTHEQHEGRPSDGELREAIERVKAEVEAEKAKAEA